MHIEKQNISNMSDKESNSSGERGSTRSQNPDTPVERQGVKFRNEISS